MARKKNKKLKSLETEKTYFIDFEELASQGLSVEFLITQRLEANGVKVKNNSKIAELLNQCSKFKRKPYDFISSELGLAESVFRALLIRKNEHCSMHQIQSDLSSIWLDHYKLPYKNLSDSVIESILEKDKTYGIKSYTA